MLCEFVVAKGFSPFMFVFQILLVYSAKVAPFNPETSETLGPRHLSRENARNSTK